MKRVSVSMQNDENAHAMVQKKKNLRENQATCTTPRPVRAIELV